MKIRIIAVGKLKEKFWKAACEEYAKRINPYAHLQVCEASDRDPAKVGGAQKAMFEEAGEILRLAEGYHVVLLAIDGLQRSSEDFAARLDALALQGISNIAFIIGGSTGVDESVVRRADETLSFGKITMPHNLARVVLLEQVYRAFKISRGEPYHK